MIGALGKLIFIVIVGAALASCTKEPPKCSDEGTFALVRSILVDQLGGGEGVTASELRENLKIEYPRASAFDEKIKKYSCEAKLIAGGIYQLPITYESQLDDKNQHLVSVGGIQRGDLMGIRNGVIMGIAKGRTEASVSKQSDTPPPNSPDKDSTIAPHSVQPEPVSPPVTKADQPIVSEKLKPSFDCGKASTSSEKSVCSDPLLGQLDGALAQNYKYMLAADIGDGAKADLKAKQRGWLADRNKCTDTACLVVSYRKRVDEVCDYPVISGLHPICTSADAIK